MTMKTGLGGSSIAPEPVASVASAGQRPENLRPKRLQTGRMAIRTGRIDRAPGDRHCSHATGSGDHATGTEPVRSHEWGQRNAADQQVHGHATDATDATGSGDIPRPPGGEMK
jgi:hypothetical protein